MAVEVIGRDEDLRSLNAFLDRRRPPRPDRDRARGRGRDREVDALERRRRSRARAGAARALLAAGRVRARTRPRRPGRPVRRAARRRPARTDGAAAPGARGRAPRSRMQRAVRSTRGLSGSPFATRCSCSPRTGSSSRSTTSSGSTRPRRARSGSRFAGCPRPTCCSSGRAGSVRGSRRLPVENALDPDRIERVRVGPLSVGAMHQLLRAPALAARCRGPRC